MKKIIILSVLCAGTLSASVYTGASVGYFKNKDFKGPMAGLHLGYKLNPLTERVGHAIELEGLFGALKANKSASLEKTAEGDDKTYTYLFSRRNEVKVRQLPLLLNYRLDVALDDAKKWKLELGIGGGVQYSDFKATERLGLLLDKEDYSPTVSDEAAKLWQEKFHTTEPVTTTKKKSWKAVGSLTAGISFQASEQLSFGVRARALISPKSHVWAGQHPLKTGTEIPVMPATAKLGAVQYGVEAVMNYNF
jgi:opacity protein-like surface antigen